MNARLDFTHDPERKSWVDSANLPDCEFPIQNLPFGVAEVEGKDQVLVAIGDYALRVAALVDAGLVKGEAAQAAKATRSGRLNELMGLGRSARLALRRELSEVLEADAPKQEALLVPRKGLAMKMPCDIGDYSDFYASVHHATNVGRMFRPDNPLLPNYKYIPVGYHGRASSIVESGTPVRRPSGQTIGADATVPTFGPSRLLDYELEVGFFVGEGNTLGEPIPISEAGDQIFGLSLVNDWSARDLQKWEYQPLGPFLAKNFLTSICPWVVTTEALEPYRVAAFERPEGDPAPLPHLLDAKDQAAGAFDLTLEAYILTPAMREAGRPAHRLSRGSFRHMYWTPAQMLAHHSSSGCNMRPGDLLASGTVSGPEKDSRGCLLELTWRGSEPVELPEGEIRKFLQDGDDLILRGFAQAEGRARIGLGEVRGRILPAHPLDA